MKQKAKVIIGYPDAPMGNETYNLVKHDVDEDITVDPSSLDGKKIGVLDSAMKGTLNDFLPYCDTDSSGNVTGVIKDIIPRIIENLDITGLDRLE